MIQFFNFQLHPSPTLPSDEGRERVGLKIHRREKIFVGKHSGFGLLEVIIAVYLIMTGLLGAMSLVKYIVASVSISSSRLVAMNLAQEGIEIVRSIRDRGGNQSEWNSWYSNLANGDYMVQYDDVVLPQTAGRIISQPADNKILKYNSASGLFTYDDSGAVNSPLAYRRKITIKKAPLPDENNAEISVVSEVTWTVSGVTGAVSRTIKVEDRLWNWLVPVKSP